MEAVQMGWDFWRIAWPNAALLFALAITPLVALLGFTSPAAQHPATEIVYQSVPALANQHAQADEQAADE